MAIIGSDIMRRAGILLLDEEHVRWTLLELAEWINDAVRAIVIAKPSASTRDIVIHLQAGTLQNVPTDGTPAPQQLISITRNLRSAEPPRLAGRAIGPTSRAALDAREPNWHDERVVQRRREVKQFFVDVEDPLRFWVYPGNDGGGLVEAIVSVLPAPLMAAGDTNLLSSWNTAVGLKDVYATPILDYVLYRAQSKDDTGANPGRAATHFQAFSTALGIGADAEGRASPSTRRNG